MTSALRLLFAGSLLLNPLAVSAGVDYEKELKPLLRVKCMECHGSPRHKKRMEMDVAGEFSKYVGPEGLIVPFKPDQSKLFLLVESGDMPKEGELTEEEVILIKTWIAEGASFEPGGSKMAAPAAPEAPDKDAIQTWTSNSGSSIKAFFVKVDGENVVLRSESGQEKAFPISIFTAQSQALIKKLSE